MIDKFNRRLLKEGLIALYRAHPAAMRYPVYYLPIHDKEPAEIGDAVRSLHGINELPWPDENCIICTEDHITEIVQHPVKIFVLIIRDGKTKRRYNLLPKAPVVHNIEPLNIFVVACDTRNKNKIWVTERQITLTHMDQVFEMPLSDSAEYYRFAIARFVADVSVVIPEEATKKLERYWRHCYATKMTEGIWTATELAGRKKNLNTFVGLASDILAYLSNIAFPCHYCLISRFREGFGPTGEMRRHTQNKPVFSIISADRLYRLYGKNEYVEISPHFRRGHIRHHWKKAGLNRFALPDSPADRIRLVFSHKVERSYIPPMWIGERVKEEPDVIHEILTEEIPLKTWRQTELQKVESM